VRVGRTASWALVGALVLGAAALRFAGARALPTPWIAPDETLYGMLGRSLWSDGRLAVMGEPIPFYSLIHPLLVGLPLELWDGVTGYRVAQALGALAMAATALPVFAWGRTLMRPGWALVAAVLTVAIPSLVLSALLMTETVFYPLATLAAWALAASLERPTPARQALLVAAVLLACATRLQGVVFLPVLLTAAVVHGVLVRSPRTALRLWPSAAALGAAGLVWAVWRVVRHGGAADVLAGYRDAADRSLSPMDAFVDVVRHLGGVVWVVGLVPVVALVALLVLARLRAPSPRDAALLAVAGSLAVWLAIEVGLFAANYVDFLAERDLIAAAPPLFLVLCRWLDLGAPGRRRVLAGAAFGAVALVALIPLDTWVDPTAIPSAPSFAILDRIGPGSLGWVVAGILAALVALLPRRLLVLVPAVLVAAFATASVAAADQAQSQASLIYDRLLAPDRSWIDRASTGPTAYVYDGEGNWNGVWELAFWNRRISSVVTLPETRLPGPMPQRQLAIRSDGTTDPAARAAYAVAPDGIELAGEPVARARQENTAHEELVLWRLDGPLRLRSRLTGVFGNGDIYGAGRLTVWDCRRGRLLLTVLGKSGKPIQIFWNEQLVVTLDVPNGGSQFVAVPVQRRPLREGPCIFDVRSGGIFGTTQFRFER
jgi:hypothetical protein